MQDLDVFENIPVLFVSNKAQMPLALHPSAGKRRRSFIRMADFSLDSFLGEVLLSHKCRKCGTLSAET